jgi:hypothetical protein
MPFTYTVSDPEKIVFTRLKEGCGRSLFIMIGSLFTIIGIGLFVFTEDPEMPLATMRFLFPAFGLVAVFAGIKLPEIQRRTTPDEIIFDNANGRVQVNQAASDIKTGYIYFDEIQDLIIQTKKVETSNRSDTSTTGTYYTYHVYLLKKDGGQWELLKRSTEALALADIIILKNLIQFSATPKREHAQINQSRKFSVTNSDTKTELSWRNPLGYGPLFLFLFCVAFLTTAYTIFSTATSMDFDMPVFGYFVAAFIGIVFVVVITGNILKLVKNSKTIYGVAVSPFAVDYFERDLGGRIMKNVQFPMTDLHALSFSFDTDQSLRKIFIYTHEQFRKKDSFKPSFSVHYVKELYDFYQSLVALDLQDVPAVEALQIENFLQEKIREVGKTEVA